MISAPYLNIAQLQDSVRRSYGAQSGRLQKEFTDDQLDIFVEIFAHVLQMQLSGLARIVDMAIHDAAPTKDQIHKLFLDKLMEHDK